jgi:ABC-type Fe3+ transport system permease subunit
MQGMQELRARAPDGRDKVRELASRIVRLIGWVFLAVGFLLLIRDVLVSIEIKHWAPITLGQLWFDLSHLSVYHFQVLLERHANPFLWDPIIVTVLLCWAFAVLMVLGMLILAVSLRRRRRPPS